MDKKCDACEFLRKPKHQLLVTPHWSVGLGNNHAYLGRAYATLRSHKGSLGELNDDEWQEFTEIVRKLEKAYKTAFGAEPLNWGSFMNHAFRTEPANPHVHWHLWPRYTQAPEIAGVSFPDPNYGEFVDDVVERIVDDSVVQQIQSHLRSYL